MFNKRQIDLLRRIATLGSSAIVLSAPITKRLFVYLMTFFQLLSAMLFDLPTYADGPEIDMSKFELVWEDEFNTGELDYKYWGGHYVYGPDYYYKRDTAYWHMGQIGFDDENLLINVEYKENGPAGAGYYSCGIDTNILHTFNPDSTGYEQTYGYFEIRCIFPKGDGMNPAFWLLSEGMFTENNTSGAVGCEIDVFETGTNHSKEKKKQNSIYQTVHVGSYNENHKQEIQGWYFADKPYEQYNTYGFEWNEDGYIFYVNGVESNRTSFGDVCQVPLFLIISVGVDENIANNKNLPAQMKVDYVRAYQYK